MNKLRAIFKKIKIRLKNLVKKKGLAKGIISLFFYGLLFAAIIILVVAAYFAKDLPNPEKLVNRQVTESTKIYDRTGEVLLYDIHGEEKRTIIPFDEMPPYVKEATLVTEDASFYRHFGLDFKGILRAVLANITGRRFSQGASTITQQFVRSSFLTPEKTISRKIKEAILSVELEILYPKDKIFEGYLNQIPYGSNAYGIEAASETFFNKKAKDLSLSESALLAALPQAPSRYSPYGSHYDDLKARQEYILDRMASFNYISKEEAENAKKETLLFTPPKTSIKAPHFVMYIKEILEEKYGTDFMQKSGLKVYTTLDWDLQKIAEEVVASGVKTNEKKYKSFNASLVAEDPKTGQILAMVGSKDYFADSSPKGCTPGNTCKFEPNVNVAIRSRQPGSSFKPYAYARALEKGYTPQTVLFDLPTEFNASCPASAGYVNYQGQQCYNPQNYDGKYRGPVTMKTALAQSLNIPAVKTLYLAGINETVSLAQKMGITTLKDKSYYGLALVLGGGEVKLTDMVSGYSVFATEGTKNEQTPILEIQSSDGKIIEEYKKSSKKVLEKETARNISNILSDNSARAPVFGSASPLYLGARPAAVKTGTTNDNRDAWTIGYTPSLTAGVWAGNNDNSPMTREGAGMYAAAPLWNDFMKKAYDLKNKNNQTYSGTALSDDTPFKAVADQPGSGKNDNIFRLPKDIEEFAPPQPIATSKAVLNGQHFVSKTYNIDKISGKLATDQTPPELVEQKEFAQVHCILYYVDKDNPRGDFPKNPADDPQFPNWEAAVLEWAKTNNIFSQPPPEEFDTTHTPANQPQAKIIFPLNNSALAAAPTKIEAQASGPLGIKQVDFFFDGSFIGADQIDPYGMLFAIPFGTQPGEHVIKIRAYDQALNKAEDEVNVMVP